MRWPVYIFANARYIELGTSGSNAIELSDCKALVSLSRVAGYCYFCRVEICLGEETSAALTAHNGRAIQSDGSASVSIGCSTRLNCVTLPSCWSDLKESEVAVAAVTAAATMTSDVLRIMVVALFFPLEYE
jgi:hypothetical protein